MTDQPATLAEALALLQTRLPEIKKASKAQYGAYADLADVSKALLPVMGELGLSFSAKPTWVTREDGTREFVLSYRLAHGPSGDEDWGEYPLGTNVANHQALGSAITYGRRYCLCALTGAVADADDDGQAASAPSPPRGRAKPPPRPVDELPRNTDGTISRKQTTDEEKAAAGIMTDGAQKAHNALERDILGTDSKGRVHAPQGEHLDGTPPDDPWLQSPPAAISRPRPAQDPAQQIAMHFQRLGVTDRDVRLGYTATLAGRDTLATTKDLTAREGLAVLGKLARCKDADALLAALEVTDAG